MVVVAPTLAKVLAALAAFIIIAFAMPAKYAESLHKYAKARCLKVALTTIPYTYVRRSLIKKNHLRCTTPAVDDGCSSNTFNVFYYHTFYDHSPLGLCFHAQIRVFAF